MISRYSSGGEQVWIYFVVNRNKTSCDRLDVGEREREASKIIYISGLNHRVSGIFSYGVGKIGGKLGLEQLWKNKEFCFFDAKFALWQQFSAFFISWYP